MQWSLVVAILALLVSLLTFVANNTYQVASLGMSATIQTLAFTKGKSPSTSAEIDCTFVNNGNVPVAFSGAFASIKTRGSNPLSSVDPRMPEEMRGGKWLFALTLQDSKPFVISGGAIEVKTLKFIHEPEAPIVGDKIAEALRDVVDVELDISLVVPNEGVVASKTYALGAFGTAVEAQGRLIALATDRNKKEAPFSIIFRKPWLSLFGRVLPLPSSE